MTAEFAVVLPVLAVMLAAVLAAGSAGVAKLRCIDAARSAARLAARHEPAAAALAAARSAGPAGAVVRLSVAGDLVRVRVTARVQLPLPGRPTVELSATSVAQLEQSPAEPVSTGAGVG
ncbi:MAG TPA: TadE family type IV pilus minor pilin [Kineosporiaceae bacterium]|nr:TadE family type IV pilus minor pilin [Kineosporiaceae bacterium]